MDAGDVETTAFMGILNWPEHPADFQAVELCVNPMRRADSRWEP